MVTRSPYVSPDHKLSFVGRLEALRGAADEEYERSGNEFIPRFTFEGKPMRTGYAVAVIKGPPPPRPRPRTSNKVAVQGGNHKKAEFEIQIAGEVTHGLDGRA